MDINYLLEREQIERIRAERAACANSRAAHRELAERYRSLVDQHRRGVVAESAMAHQGVHRHAAARAG